MSEPNPSITVAVDPTNPGQFFACCGLLELADRLWPGAEGWFTTDGQKFFISFSGDTSGTLRELLAAVKSIQIEADEEEDSTEDESGEEQTVEPLVINSPVSLRLDWFEDTNLKPWAGSMNPKRIMAAMTTNVDPEWHQPFAVSLITRDPQRIRTGRGGKETVILGKPREPFYFDSRRGVNVIDRDVGFVPDGLKKAYKTYTHAFPAVEALAPIGLQRARPKRARYSREFDYYTWTWRLPCTLVSAAVLGIIGDVGAAGFRFWNAFRTGQDKHKAYMQATPILTGDDQ